MIPYAAKQETKVAITVVESAIITLFLIFTVNLSVNKTVRKFSHVQLLGQKAVGFANISLLDLNAETNSHSSGNIQTTDNMLRKTYEKTVAALTFFFILIISCPPLPND